MSFIVVMFRDNHIGVDELFSYIKQNNNIVDMNNSIKTILSSHHYVISKFVPSIARWVRVCHTWLQFITHGYR